MCSQKFLNENFESLAATALGYERPQYIRVLGFAEAADKEPCTGNWPIHFN